MMVLLLGLLLIGGVAAYDMNDWKYVGYHECKRIGYLHKEKSTVYPATVDNKVHYILYKQKNNDGTYTVNCTIE